jgi:hypothetical protein
MVCPLPGDPRHRESISDSPPAGNNGSGSLTLRGITGDLYLSCTARPFAVRDVRVETSLEAKRVTFNLALDAAPPPGFTVEAEAVMGDERTAFAARPVAADEIRDGRLRVSFPWPKPKVWDLDTPQNQYRATVTLRAADDLGVLASFSMPHVKEFDWKLDNPEQARLYRQLGDWLEHWQQDGVKPVFFVEWRLPHIASWSTYRGPNFIWRTPAIQQIWDAEYAAAEKGPDAYRPTPDVVRSLFCRTAVTGTLPRCALRAGPRISYHSA